jgi:uncharacterized protein with PIN domain
VTVIRLYFDTDSMEKALLAGLRARGVDAITALEAGLADGSDEEQLRFASSQGRVLFSFNAGDFCRIHAAFLAQGQPHAGIVVAPQQRYSSGQRLRRLLRLIGAKTAEEMQNQLEFLSQWG